MVDYWHMYCLLLGIIVGITVTLFLIRVNRREWFNAGRMAERDKAFGERMENLIRTDELEGAVRYYRDLEYRRKVRRGELPITEHDV